MDETIDLRIGEANAVREQMLAIVSHDIKNPLSIIQLEAQMLLKLCERHEDTLFSDKVRSQASRILKTSERIKALINDLLDRNKSEEGLACLKKSDCDFISLCLEVLESQRLLLKQKELSTNICIEGDWTVSIDKNKISQVVANLLSNAIKFSPHGSDIQLSIHGSSDEVVCSITDNGPGLKNADLHRVFEKYWTGVVGGNSGTGLGLFICKTIVEAHGGHISVENRPDHGASFSFSLPIQNESSRKNWLKDKKQKILIIDDDEDLRELICWVLGVEGYGVQAYGDPLEALESLREGRHIPQLMIVDFQMQGMNGLEFLASKREIGYLEVSQCPVLLMSASSDELDMSGEPKDLKDVLKKPLDLESLVEKIKFHVVMSN
jgi:CheY-like chemotaxis protein/two-component sensor histidine kinase